MTVTVELVKNNDPRLGLGIPILDIYLDEPMWAEDVSPGRVLHHISMLGIFRLLDECDALVLFDERFDIDLDVCVLVCHAILDDRYRVWHAMCSEGGVPTVWERLDQNATP